MSGHEEACSANYPAGFQGLRRRPGISRVLTDEGGHNAGAIKVGWEEFG